jgi:hypothetical protein
MASFRDKVISALLKTIRARRESKASVQPSFGAVKSAKLREARFSDCESVAALKARWSMAADSAENWQRIWRDNPALAITGLDRPIGWVLEAEGQIVGYLGNIARLYEYEGRTLISVTSHALVVDLPYRALGVSLVAAYYRQKNADLFISTGAIEPVGKIARAFKSEVLLQWEKETVSFWVLKPHAFVTTVLRELRVNAAISAIAAGCGSPLLACDRIRQRRRLSAKAQQYDICEIPIEAIGEEFRAFWRKVVASEHRLLAVRDPEALRWHLQVPGDAGSAHILACRSNGNFIGYIAIRHEPIDRTGLQKSVIVDVLVQDDDPDAIEALFVAAYKHSQRAGTHILESLGLPRAVRQVLSKFRPYSRTYPTRLYGYKAIDPDLHVALSDGVTWYATPFDGDLTLIRSSHPAPSAEKFSPLTDSCISVSTA